MHLNDALINWPNIEIICMQHEQAAAMAAEGYARVDGRVGVLSTSSGPAALNALTGLYGAYVDSLPVICIAGQSKRELLRSAQLSVETCGIRQLGVQEANAVSMAKSITKYSTTIFEPFQIRYELEKSWHIAVTDRPGPVFIEIPLDVQSAVVEPERLPQFIPLNKKMRVPSKSCYQVIEILRRSKRPVLVGGEGVREANAVISFQKIANLLQIPVVTAWMPDIYPIDRPYYSGRLGTLGTRAGNFAVQNADFLLVIGSRLAPPQVGFNWEAFARDAYVVSVNQDEAELTKPISTVDHPIVANPNEFMSLIMEMWPQAALDPESWHDWRHQCFSWVHRYPEIDQSARLKESPPAIDPYIFINRLFELLEDDAFVACGNALSACVAFQAAPIRKSQRVTSNAAAGSMGHDLPSAIGSAIAREGKRVICLAGDGSLMMNLQELQTVVHMKLPIGIFVLNNNGYHSIRTTQKNYFGRLIGESNSTGLSLPDYFRVAEAFGLKAYRINSYNYAAQLQDMLADRGPWLCDVLIDPEIGLEPRASSKMLEDGRMVAAPIEDMYPFLEKEEFLKNMIIPPLQEQ